MALATNYADWIVQKFAPFLTGHGAEIGAGIGTISRKIVDMVDSLTLVEPAPNLAGELALNFGNDKTVSVDPRKLEDWINDAPENFYDSILMVNVLEHIEDDKNILSALHEKLAAGGHLMIFVPAMPFLYSKIDKLHGHFRRYERAGLGGVLKEAGFELKHIEYFDALGVVPWYLVNTLGGATDFNPHAIKIYDSVGVPITKFFESVVSFPFGKNVVAVARKGDAQSSARKP